MTSKAAHERYNRSEKGKARWRRYAATHPRRNDSPRQQLSVMLAGVKYAAKQRSQA